MDGWMSGWMNKCIQAGSLSLASCPWVAGQCSGLWRSRGHWQAGVGGITASVGHVVEESEALGCPGQKSDAAVCIWAQLPLLVPVGCPLHHVTQVLSQDSIFRL